MDRRNLIHMYGFTSAIICICLLWPSINAITYERQLAHINDVKCADSCIVDGLSTEGKCWCCGIPSRDIWAYWCISHNTTICSKVDCEDEWERVHSLTVQNININNSIIISLLAILLLSTILTVVVYIRKRRYYKVTHVHRDA
jgi:hypothetical protein